MYYNRHRIKPLILMNLYFYSNNNNNNNDKRFFNKDQISSRATTELKKYAEIICRIFTNKTKDKSNYFLYFFSRKKNGIKGAGDLVLSIKSTLFTLKI